MTYRGTQMERCVLNDTHRAGITRKGQKDRRRGERAVEGIGLPDCHFIFHGVVAQIDSAHWAKRRTARSIDGATTARNRDRSIQSCLSARLMVPSVRGTAARTGQTHRNRCGYGKGADVCPNRAACPWAAIKRPLLCVQTEDRILREMSVRHEQLRDTYETRQ